MIAFINALSSFLRERADWIAILGGVALILIFIETRLRSLFASHEVTEQRLHAETGLLADAASAAARVAGGHIDVLRADLAEQRADLANINVLVKMHDQRLGALSERLMIAALRVPTPVRDADAE